MGIWKLTTRKRMLFRFKKGEESGRNKKQSRVFIIGTRHMPNVYKAHQSEHAKNI